MLHMHSYSLTHSSSPNIKHLLLFPHRVHGKVHLYYTHITDYLTSRTTTVTRIINITLRNDLFPSAEQGSELCETTSKGPEYYLLNFCLKKGAKYNVIFNY